MKLSVAYVLNVVATAKLVGASGMFDVVASTCVSPDVPSLFSAFKYNI